MKSSFCANSGCVDVVFVKSSFSGNQGNCVHVGYRSDFDVVEVHDEQGATVQYTKDEWDAFIAGVKNDEFDWEVLSGPTVS